jgi:hypothetical protein
VRAMKSVMGPAVCGGCRGLVWWARAWNGEGLCWRDRDGSRHRCPA